GPLSGGRPPSESRAPVIPFQDADAGRMCPAYDQRGLGQLLHDAVGNRQICHRLHQLVEGAAFECVVGGPDGRRSSSGVVITRSRGTWLSSLITRTRPREAFFDFCWSVPPARHAYT